MIPKIIHYCWFGKGILPPIAKKCIQSWKKYLPDYEIIEWNENNFDVNITKYTENAYNQKKYAFVSDYARFYILYYYGGVYLDVDVEVLKSIDKFLENKSFTGFESNQGVNPGLILGSQSGNDIFKIMLDNYSKMDFIYSNKAAGMENVVTLFTKLLVENNLKLNGKLQSVGGITIFEQEYFSPINYFTGDQVFTVNTHSIHHYASSWQPWYKRVRIQILKYTFFRYIYNLIKNN